MKTDRKTAFLGAWLIALLLPLLACAESLPNQAAIASADPLATAAGMEILDQGGNAFDAAVAVSAALAVVEPASSGLGGGAFWLLHIEAEDRDIFVDAREVAPGAAMAKMYLDEQGEPRPHASLDGPLAAGIPGQPAGLVFLADRYGRLPLAQSLVPAIRYAENGFSASRRTLMGLRFRKRAYEQWPAFAKVFLPDGDIPAIGTVIRQPDLAQTLHRLAENGFDGFYRGETAKLLVDGVRDAGGIWTAADLANYAVIEREPIIAENRGVRIISAPPPSSGGVALANMLHVLAGFDLQAMDSTTRKHLIIEAMRRAYRDRAEYLGDPDFVDIPVARLTHPYYAAGQRASIRTDRATRSADLSGIWPQQAGGTQTTHFSVLDRDGNRVAATLSINTWYGAGFMPPGTGVLLNNEMDDFVIKPATPNEYELIGTATNEIAPGKRMLSSMSPTFLESDRGVAILGTPGGSRIITMVFLASLEWMDGANASEMVSLKRYHHQFFPDEVVFEKGALSPGEQRVLTEWGHQLTESRRAFGNMNIVTWNYETGKVEAATDPRGLGEAEVRVY